MNLQERQKLALLGLRETFGERLLFNEPLARHTSARIGGPADAFLVAHTTDDLMKAAGAIWRYGTDTLPLTILGGGSNILISDAGVRGLVIHNRAEQMSFRENMVFAGSGVGTIQLARRCAKEGLSGMEWAIGIPGTIGGAVVGNAGAHGGDMAGVVEMVMTARSVNGKPQENAVRNQHCGFAYRTSLFKQAEGRNRIILMVTLSLTPGDPAAIKARMDEYNAYRKRTQPPGATIGSMFKNPPGDYAGRLIDAAGLKGTQIGGAQISEKHANFFLNVNEATAGDVKALADLAVARVREQFGVTLELEVELVGEWGAGGRVA